MSDLIKKTLRIIRFIPFIGHMWYPSITGNVIYRRKIKVALLAWWHWEVLPWFKKLDYDLKSDGTRIYKYRWQKFNN